MEQRMDRCVRTRIGAVVLAAAMALATTACQHGRGGLRIWPLGGGGELRFMTFNILGGGETKAGGVENRGEVIRGVIERFEPDVLGLNECNNWHRDNAKMLRLYEQRFDMSGIMAVKHGSGVAALFRRDLPIREVLTDTQRQGHGLIMLEIMAPDGKPIKVFITHMMHTDPPTRMKELKEVLRYIGPGERAIVMGDLNSISGRDKAKLDDVPKNQHKRFTEKGKIHTAVIDGYEKAGLVDAYRLKHPNSDTAADQTVGTKISKDPAHAKAPLRLDYILVSKDLADAVQSCEIINDGETNRASDHFPLVLDLKF